MTNPSLWRHTLGDLLRRSAARFPNKPAIICGETQWTYAEFDTLSNRLANGLADAGVGMGDRVGVLSRNSHAFAALRFALAKLGAVIVPVNFMLNASEIAYILGHSGATRLALGPDMVDLGREAAEQCASVTELIWLPGEHPAEPPQGMRSFDGLLADDDTEPQTNTTGASLLQIIYTSGTESLPKGAMLTHESVIWQYTTCIADGEITEGDRLLHALPLYHCAQLDVFLGPGVYVGATNVITGSPTPERILELIGAHGINSFFAPPSIWIALLRAPQFAHTDLSGLHKGYYGASIMPVPVLLELSDRLPALRLWNFYGQTEIAPVATVLKPHEQLSHAGSAGRAALNVETRVVDDQMQDVAPGEVGEIVHRSPQLLQGYFDDDERTAAAFEGDWFHSGDLATRDADGYITVVDRKKDMIKTGGENVASREVEEAIYRYEPVSEVAVIGLPHPYWIEAVTALVVARPDAGFSEDALIEHCRQALAHYKVPKRVLVVESLPKNPSGKLLKRELRTAYKGLYAGDED